MKTIFTWTARIIGLIASLFFVSLLIDDARDHFEYSNPVFWTFVPWLLLAFCGYVLAWFKPRSGGRIATLAGILMLCFLASYQDWFSAILYGSPFILIGLLFMLSGPTHKQRQDS